MLVRALDPAARAQRKAESCKHSLLPARHKRGTRQDGSHVAAASIVGVREHRYQPAGHTGQAHDEMIVQLAGLSRTFGGGGQSF